MDRYGTKEGLSPFSSYVSPFHPGAGGLQDDGTDSHLESLQG
jgi:hypothetical protein